jgi:Transposase and inactivated derivatives
MIMVSPAPDTEKPVFHTIPVQLTEAQFEQFILPHLSLPKRGPHCKIGYHRVFNYILTVLYTGMQWKQLPVIKDAAGQAEIHYTVVYKLFARWADDGSLKRAFIASVAHLEQEQQLSLSILHGDGTNTVAKKGAMPSATRDINTNAARRSWRSRTTTASSSRP